MKVHRFARSAWMLLALGLVLACATPAAAEVSSFEVQEYSEDFDVSSERAEANLETQQRGIAIVAQLKLALGKQYAGVWFDNQAGEFVVPLLPPVSRADLESQLSDTPIRRDYRVTGAHSS